MPIATDELGMAPTEIFAIPVSVVVELRRLALTALEAGDDGGR